MTEWEKAEAGLLYDAKYDPDLDRGRKASQELSFDYNALRPSQIKEREEMVRKHFKKTGKKFLIEQPFRCDFWERVSVGENFYSNYNFVVLAGNTIDIGDNVMFAPDCGLYAAGHPFDVELRIPESSTHGLSALATMSGSAAVQRLSGEYPSAMT